VKVKALLGWMNPGAVKRKTPAAFHRYVLPSRGLPMLRACTGTAGIGEVAHLNGNFLAGSAKSGHVVAGKDASGSV
jgi:hypothetical protein